MKAGAAALCSIGWWRVGARWLGRWVILPPLWLGTKGEGGGRWVSSPPPETLRLGWVGAGNLVGFVGSLSTF